MTPAQPHAPELLAQGFSQRDAGRLDAPSARSLPRRTKLDGFRAAARAVEAEATDPRSLAEAVRAAPWLV